LWHIVITRLSGDPRTQAYAQRRAKQGRTNKEIIRVLKLLAIIECRVL
jgi:hypothetical protein